MSVSLNLWSKGRSASEGGRTETPEVGDLSRRGVDTTCPASLGPVRPALFVDLVVPGGRPVAQVSREDHLR